MFSVDDAADEPWGDVPYVVERPALQVGSGWLDALFSMVAMLAGVLGAMGALRLGDPRKNPNGETQRRP